MLHYAPQHVSSSTLLIFRRTNCITTASGIVNLCKQPYSMQVESGLQSLSTCILFNYRGADKSLARPTSRCILFDGVNTSFDASLVIYINGTNIPPIMTIGYMKIKIFCRCSLFPSWSG